MSEFISKYWLGVLNFVVMQWMFIRIFRCEQPRTVGFNLDGVSFSHGGVMTARGNVTSVVSRWYTIGGPVVPLTGWVVPFIFLTKKIIQVRITGESVVKFMTHGKNLQTRPGSQN